MTFELTFRDVPDDQQSLNESYVYTKAILNQVPIVYLLNLGRWLLFTFVKGWHLWRERERERERESKQV